MMGFNGENYVKYGFNESSETSMCARWARKDRSVWLLEMQNAEVRLLGL